MTTTDGEGRERKNMIKQWFRRLVSGQFVYVLIANEQEKVKECFVVTSLAEAMKHRDNLTAIYGAANVAFASRKIDHIPANIRDR